MLPGCQRIRSGLADALVWLSAKNIFLVRTASKRKDPLTFKYGKSEEVGHAFGLSKLVKYINRENVPNRCCPKELKIFPFTNLKVHQEEEEPSKNMKPRNLRGFQRMSTDIIKSDFSSLKSKASHCKPLVYGCCRLGCRM